MAVRKNIGFHHDTIAQQPFDRETSTVELRRDSLDRDSLAAVLTRGAPVSGIDALLERIYHDYRSHRSSAKARGG